MNKDSDDKEFAEDLEVVSAEYHAIVTESVPAWLNKEVLRNAAARSSRTPLAAMFMLWGRPLAFVATAGLSLALLLPLSQAPVVDDAGEYFGLPFASREDSSGSADALSRAVEESGKRLEDLNLSSGAAQPITANRSCSELESVDAATWWRCIEGLQNSGRTADAKSELALHKIRHPDFTPPE